MCSPCCSSEEQPTQEQRTAVHKKTAPYSHTEEESDPYKDDHAIHRTAASLAEVCWAPGGLREEVWRLRTKAVHQREKFYTEREVIHISLKASSLKY